MEGLETAGLSTGFIVIIGILYRVLKQSDFSFNSSCKRRIVDEAKKEMEDYIKERVEREVRSVTTSPTHAGAVAPPLPDTPPAININ